MSKEKGEQPNYIGTLILVAFMIYGFIVYDDIGTEESIHSSVSKRKILPILFNYINKTTIGYVIGRGSFLALAFYGLNRMYKKFKNRPK